MKTYNKLTNAFLILGFLVSAGCSKIVAESGSSELDIFKGEPTKTAQGIMIAFDKSVDDFGEVNTQIYKFNRSTGSTFFNNLNTGLTVACSGSPTDCGAANRPSNPAVPAPSSSRAEDFAWTLRCLFLDGGSLTGTSFYNTDITKNGLNGRGNWKFSFAFTISPLVATLDPMTAWDLFHESNPETGTPAAISIGALIAGESVIDSGKLGIKYSFSLRNSDGSSRVNDLALSLDGTVIANPLSTIVENAPGAKTGDAGALDFIFTSNAATNGYTNLLSDGASPGNPALAKDARTILNTDSFAGNNDGGSDGRALALAVVDPIEVPATAGEHTLTLSGVVKGIDASASQTFTTTRRIHIVAEGCSSAP
jgi:hypothetical protein